MRGQYWKNSDPEKTREQMRSNALKRWANKSATEKHEYAMKMVRARRKKMIV